MYKLDYLKTAKEDIYTIADYVANDLKNKSAAIKLVNSIIKKAKNIAIFPYESAVYTNDNSLKNIYKKSKVKNYLIFYTVDDYNNTVTIVRALYKRRNFAKLF